MFQHIFATLHDMLDDIRKHYAQAEVTQKKYYDEQLSMLKSMSDEFLEEWLLFEEKMAELNRPDEPSGSSQLEPAGNKEQLPAAAAAQTEQAASKAMSAAEMSMTEPEMIAMGKGQGYFKLFMFREAVHYFQEAIMISPENNMARLFLAMAFMHLQDWNEAQRHFQLLVELTEHPKWQALGYNALGCIQAVRMNLEQAEQYFLKAHETDPTFADPLANLEACQQHAGHLSLYFGSGQL